MSHPAWGAWIEITVCQPLDTLPTSHPAWGAWIEMWVLLLANFAQVVAPRMGCVD